MQDDFISTSVSSFNKFLSEHETYLKKNKTGGILISFAAKTENIPLLHILKKFSNCSGRLFYYDHPEENFSFLGINESVLISEKGIARFAATGKKSVEWKYKCINNWEVIPHKSLPFFVGGMKFSEGHQDELWDDYNDSTWFIPEIALVKTSEKDFILFNFIVSSGFNIMNAHEMYAEKLKAVFEESNYLQNAETVSIKAISGDTPKNKKKWKSLVSDALDNILDKKVEKVVYSRYVEYKLSSSPDYKSLIEKLRKFYPSCYIFIFRSGGSVFFGATPEKLASFSGGHIEIDSLAGSAPRSAVPEEDAAIENSLLRDEKNLSEHNIVINYIKDSLSKYSDKVEQGETTVKKLVNIQHLWTKISAQITTKESAFSLLNELYPTPAICGVPKKNALELIKKNESYQRGMYSGIIGWYSFPGNTGNEITDMAAEFVVAIRSALIKNDKLFVFAGNGIVSDSDPAEEFKETELKLKPILSLFNNEN